MLLLIALLACDGGLKPPTYDSETPADSDTPSASHRFTRFAAADNVEHERVPDALLEAETPEAYMAFFYGSGEAGGVSGSWSEGSGPYPYQLFTPSDASGLLPLVLILHTRGEQGTDNTRQISTTQVSTWVDFMPEPTLVLAPQAPEGTRDWSTEDLDALLDTVMAEQGADEDRVFLSGHSFGGAGALGMLSESSHRFAAASLFAPSGDNYANLDLAHMVGTPQWYVVSESDRIVDADTVEAFYDALVAATP